MQCATRWLAMLAAALVLVSGSRRPAEAQEQRVDEARNTETPPPLGLANVAAPPAPKPAPGGPPNVFYGAVPPSPVFPAQSTVLVFLHGLHGTASNWWLGNDMYEQAFHAGYRTAFISINADNSPNDASFLDNGVALASLLPVIADHYQGEKLILIGHSMGGLDAQAAMMDPEIRRLVRAVFTISAPNTGTELADWAFGDGLPIAGGLGLLTPGVFSLRTESVATFRALAEPILSTSGIPFFTLEGSDARGNPITGVTGVILAGLTPGHKNDGLVPVPRGKLPAEWSTDLGEVKTNHFDVDSGSQTFVKIQARLMALEYTLQQFARIVANGFGDAHNTWMWSMQWFQGQLYVGTGREIQCLSQLASDVQTGTNLYPLAVVAGDCPDRPGLNRSIGAEIWRYDPATREWERAYKSPDSVFLGIIDGEPVFTARDVGFRGMTVFTETDGTEALYIGGVTAGSSFDNLPPFAEGFPPPRLLRSVDGVSFDAVPQAPGTFLGDIGKPLPGSARSLRSFRALTAYKGKLFATVGDFRGVGVVIGSANPNLGNDAWFLASPVSEQFPTWNLITYNDFLYATTGDSQLNNDGFGLYKTAATGTPPFAWTPIIVDGGWQRDPVFRAPNGLSFAIFHGQLYLGTNRPTELYRVNPDDSWDLVVGEPRLTPQGFKTPLTGMGIGFGNWFNGHFWRMAVHDGQLYLTTWDWSVGLRSLDLLDKFFGFQYGLDFYRTRDGKQWEAITRGGFLDGVNSGGRSILSTPAGLFVGTERAKGGAEIYLCAPPDCTDLEAPAALPPPQNLEAASELLVERQVVLSWDPSPSAQRYRVYRSTVRPIVEFLPPDLEIPIPGLGITLTLGGILAGDFDFLCELPPSPTATTLCDVITAVKNVRVGVPMPFVQVGIEFGTSFLETAPNHLQSIYFVRAEDADGNLSTPSNFVGAPSKAAPGGIPTVPPTVAAKLSPPPNAAGWNNADVTVSWAISTPGAALASAIGCDAMTISGEGTTTLTCTATNSSGQTTEHSVDVRIDRTPPVITGGARPGPNIHGWNNTDVTVAFTCSDSVSAVAQCGAVQVVQTEGSGQSRSGAATDLAGNTATAVVEGINIDKTPPVIFAASNPPPNENNWNNTDVTVGFSAADPLSGVASTTGAVRLSQEGPGQVVNGITFDRAGNSAQTTAVVNIDRTAPEAALQVDTPTSRLVALGRDALSGIPAGPIGPESSAANRRLIYRVVDRAGNALVLGVSMRQTTHELDGRVETLQYNDGPVLSLPANHARAAWRLGANGQLRQLEQDFRAAPPPDGQWVRAEFNAKKNVTVIHEGSHKEKPKKTAGVRLLQLATQGGRLLVKVEPGTLLVESVPPADPGSPPRRRGRARREVRSPSPPAIGVLVPVNLPSPEPRRNDPSDRRRRLGTHCPDDEVPCRRDR